ncbi:MULTISPECIES: anthranilate synthase component I family protein [unclassified Moraxella]|uniref:anthranilate synthase component I family protein n=1 Tax=unclassified Moraxella TaxID=2685852 RepID=UPI003AF72F01
MINIHCPFLTALPPTELVLKFSHFSTIKPIWLNNDGQNIIGILPKTAFLADLANNDNSQAQTLQIHQLNRQSIDFTQSNYSINTLDNVNQADLQRLLIDYQNIQTPQEPSNQITEKPHFYNGYLGFISYDFSAENLANQSFNADYVSQPQPLAYFGHYDIYLTLQDGKWWLNLTTEQAIKQREAIECFLSQLSKQFSNVEINNNPKPLPLAPVWTKSDYAKAFEQVQNYLKAGDCYQINLTQCWQGDLANNKGGNKLVDYLPRLHQATNAPFAGYVNLDNSLSNYELLSCSPELFFTFAKNTSSINNRDEHTIITKPIKGTIPRGLTVEQDIANKNQLANSEKDTAENVMIVDLLRNDLGKYAKVGTVQVPKLFDIESFSNVHHMVSTVTATLKEEVNPLTVLLDSLPAGSITGTPKKRAVEIIHELESQPRGAYCGTLGYLNFDGTGQWNVLIRTLQAVDDKVSLWAGGGVTIASACEAEYQECFDKVGNLLKLLMQND